jgi:hypothetical protein
MEGRVFREGTIIKGVRFGDTDSYRLELRPTRFEKSVFPEAAITPDWPTLELSAEGGFGAPPESWACELIFIDSDSASDEVPPDEKVDQ